MTQINLLPPEIRSRQRARRILVLVLGAAGVVLGILVIVLLVQLSTINKEEDKLAELERQQAELAAEVARLQPFGQLFQNVDDRQKSLATALTGDVAWSKLLNDVSLILPDNSWLVNMAMNAQPGVSQLKAIPTFGTVSFQAITFDFPGMAGWLVRLAQLDGLEDIYPTSGTRSADGTIQTVQFGANAGVNDRLLSLKCQQEGLPCP